MSPDEKTAIVLAMQDEMTRDGYLPRIPRGPVRRLGSEVPGPSGMLLGAEAASPAPGPRPVRSALFVPRPERLIPVLPGLDDLIAVIAVIATVFTTDPDEDATPHSSARRWAA